jgi:hypothetical protein
MFELSVELKPEVYALALAVAAFVVAVARAVIAPLAWAVMWPAIACEAMLVNADGMEGEAWEAMWPASAVVAAPWARAWKLERDEVMELGTAKVGASTAETAGGGEELLPKPLAIEEKPDVIPDMVGSLSLDGIFILPMSGMDILDPMDARPEDMEESPDEKPDDTPSGTDVLLVAEEKPEFIPSILGMDIFAVALEKPDAALSRALEKPELIPSILGMDMLAVALENPDAAFSRALEKPELISSLLGILEPTVELKDLMPSPADAKPREKPELISSLLGILEPTAEENDLIPSPADAKPRDRPLPTSPIDTFTPAMRSRAAPNPSFALEYAAAPAACPVATAEAARVFVGAHGSATSRDSSSGGGDMDAGMDMRGASFFEPHGVPQGSSITSKESGDGRGRGRS